MRLSPLIDRSDPYLVRRKPHDEDNWEYPKDLSTPPCWELERNIRKRIQSNSALILTDHAAQTIWLGKAASLDFDIDADSFGDLYVFVDLADFLAYGVTATWHPAMDRYAQVFRSTMTPFDVERDYAELPRRLYFGRPLSAAHGLANDLLQFRREMFESLMPLSPHPDTSF